MLTVSFWARIVHLFICLFHLVDAFHLGPTVCSSPNGAQASISGAFGAHCLDQWGVLWVVLCGRLCLLALGSIHLWHFRLFCGFVYYGLYLYLFQIVLSGPGFGLYYMTFYMDFQSMTRLLLGFPETSRQFLRCCSHIGSECNFGSRHFQTSTLGQLCQA